MNRIIGQLLIHPVAFVVTISNVGAAPNRTDQGMCLPNLDVSYCRSCTLYLHISSTKRVPLKPLRSGDLQHDQLTVRHQTLVPT